MRPLQCWAEFAHPGWNRVKVSENLGATVIAAVAPAITSLNDFMAIPERFWLNCERLR